jgi:hypothetical protein
MVVGGGGEAAMTSLGIGIDFPPLLSKTFSKSEIRRCSVFSLKT